VESFVQNKNTTTIKISASQHISNMNFMNYDPNKYFGLFKFQSGYRKFYLNIRKGYSRKIHMQTDVTLKTLCDRHIIFHCFNYLVIPLRRFLSKQIVQNDTVSYYFYHSISMPFLSHLS